MIKIDDILSLGYLKKTAFRGSYRGMRFLLKKNEHDEAVFLQGWAWPEPFSFDNTPDEKKVTCEWEFSNAGREQAVDWLNEMHCRITQQA